MCLDSVLATYATVVPFFLFVFPPFSLFLDRPLCRIKVENRAVSFFRRHSIKFYCPCCSDIYVSSEQTNHCCIFPPTSPLAIDGCFFGPNFPMEFLIHYPSYVHHEPIQVYEPKLYGFALSRESPAYRKPRFCEQVWLSELTYLQGSDRIEDYDRDIVDDVYVVCCTHFSNAQGRNGVTSA